MKGSGEQGRSTYQPHKPSLPTHFAFFYASASPPDLLGPRLAHLSHSAKNAPASAYQPALDRHCRYTLLPS